MTQIIASAIADSNNSAPLSHASGLSREQFTQARALFKQAARDKKLTAASICAWSVLRGFDASRGFTPVTNPIKLANGADPMGAFYAARSNAETLDKEALAPWASLLADEGCSLDRWSWSGNHPILNALTEHRRSR